jgi:hypothetical protein
VNGSADQVADVTTAVEEWNARLNRRALMIWPACPSARIAIPFSFVEELPGWCSSWYGCTAKRNIVNGVPDFIEVVISNSAPYRTIVSELGHVLGCKHGDGEPCNMFFY